jgi:phospholipid/cholesterol/gamma-HCH transport system substrate-binding protein
VNATTVRAFVGAGTIAAVVGVAVVAVGLFQNRFTNTVPLIVESPRAGLVMNPDAKVNLLGVPVGRVGRIEDLADGRAAIHLEMEPDRLAEIPDNVIVDIASPTVFGAKSINLVPPENPSPRALQPGQVLDSEHVTVEFNTIFQQLTSVLSEIQPDKLNETLGAIATAFDGRGEQFGDAMTQLNSYLARIEPSLPNLSHDTEVAPRVLNAYADAAPDLLRVADNASTISDTLVDQSANLDAFLVSTIGLADTGNDVLGGNRQGLTDLVRVLVPTLDLSNRYHEAITCTLGGLVPLATAPPLDKPGIVDSIGFQWGRERYRYPGNLPKVGGTGGPHCLSLPNVPPESRPPFVVADTGANPSQYGNQGILLNSDGLKQYLFGPLDGPPRNTAQVGQPG